MAVNKIKKGLDYLKDLFGVGKKADIPTAGTAKPTNTVEDVFTKYDETTPPGQFKKQGEIIDEDGNVVTKEYSYNPESFTEMQRREGKGSFSEESLREQYMESVDADVMSYDEFVMKQRGITEAQLEAERAMRAKRVSPEPKQVSTPESDKFISDVQAATNRSEEDIRETIVDVMNEGYEAGDPKRTMFDNDEQINAFLGIKKINQGDFEEFVDDFLRRLAEREPSEYAPPVLRDKDTMKLGAGKRVFKDDDYQKSYDMLDEYGFRVTDDPSDIIPYSQLSEKDIRLIKLGVPMNSKKYKAQMQGLQEGKLLSELEDDPIKKANAKVFEDASGATDRAKINKADEDLKQKATDEIMEAIEEGNFDKAREIEDSFNDGTYVPGGKKRTLNAKGGRIGFNTGGGVPDAATILGLFDPKGIKQFGVQMGMPGTHYGSPYGLSNEYYAMDTLGKVLMERANPQLGYNKVNPLEYGIGPAQKISGTYGQMSPEGMAAFQAAKDKQQEERIAQSDAYLKSYGLDISGDQADELSKALGAFYAPGASSMGFGLNPGGSMNAEQVQMQRQRAEKAIRDFQNYLDKNPELGEKLQKGLFSAFNPATRMGAKAFTDEEMNFSEKDFDFSDAYGAAEGGRVHLSEGGGPKFSRRGFLGLMGAGIASLATPFGKMVSKAPIGATKQAVQKVSGMPEWFPLLVNRIKTKGRVTREPEYADFTSGGDTEKVYKLEDYTMYEDMTTGKITVSGRGNDYQQVSMEYAPGQTTVTRKQNPLTGEMEPHYVTDKPTFEAGEYAKGDPYDYENFGDYDDLKGDVRNWENFATGGRKMSVKEAEKGIDDFIEKYRNPILDEDFAKGGKVGMKQGGIASRFKERVNYGN